MEQARLSPLQGVLLVVNTVLPTAVLFLPAIAAAQAGPDIWLVPLVALVGGMAIAWVYVTLAARFPGRSLIQFLPLVLGRWFGGAVGLIFLWWWLHTNSIIVREFGEFMVLAILPETPISAVIIIVVAVAAYAVRGGIEVMARANEVTAVIMLASFLLIYLLLLKETNPEYLRPVLGKGWGPVLRGAWAPVSWWGEPVTATMMILPFLPARARPLWVVWGGLILLTAFLIPAGLITQMVLDTQLIATSKLPILTTIRMINIADFIERVEPVFVALWVLGNLMKMAVFLYAFAAGLAQWAGLKEYRSLVLPSAMLVSGLSLPLFENSIHLSTFLAKAWPPYAFSIEFLVPLACLLVAVARGARAPRPAAGRQEAP